MFVVVWQRYCVLVAVVYVRGLSLFGGCGRCCALFNCCCLLSGVCSLLCCMRCLLSFGQCSVLVFVVVVCGLLGWRVLLAVCCCKLNDVV